MNKTKSIMLTTITVMIMLISVIVPGNYVGANPVPPPPHLAVNIESRIENAHPGQEILVDIEMSLLTTQGWTTASFNVHYDHTRLELLPYRTSLSGFNTWVGSNWNDPWMIAGASVWAEPAFENPGNVLVVFNIMGIGAIPFPATITLRFIVHDNAPSGEALVSWTPGNASAIINTTPIQNTRLSFAPPTSESFTRITISPQPHLALNIDSQVSHASPGQEILVSIDISLLTELGWSTAIFDIHYDRTRLELIPYDTTRPYWLPSFWIGSNITDNWRQGGGPDINPATYQGPGNIWSARIGIFSANARAIPYSAYMTLRFRVIDNAPAGEALISWTPFGATTNYGVAIFFAPPSSESYAHVTIS